MLTVPSPPALALLLLAAGPAGAQPADPAASIRTNERALADALHARDGARLDGLLAPDFVMRGAPDLDRDAWMTNAAALCWGDRSDIEGFTARPLGDIVVATFELTFYTDPVSCQPAVLRSLITDVWRRGPDRWRLAVRHSAPPPAPGVAGQFGLVPEVPPRWEATSDLSLVATAGNTSTRTLGLGAAVVHRADGSNTRGSVAFVTSDADGLTRARSLTTQARHGRRLRPALELFGRAGFARDRFAGIEGRLTGEGGLAYLAPLSPAHKLTAEGSLGVVAEERLDAIDLRFASLNGALSYLWTFRPGAEFTEEMGITADLETGSNWRGTSATALSVRLTRLLSLKLSHALEYRHLPVPGFGRTDTRTAAAVVFSWQHRR